MHCTPSLRAAAITVAALVSQIVPTRWVHAQVVISGVDSTGAPLRRAFPAGVVINHLSRGDTILAIYALDLNELVPVIVELDHPPMTQLTQGDGAILERVSASLRAQVEAQQAAVRAQIREIELELRARYDFLQPAGTEPHQTYALVFNGMALRTRRWLVAEIRKLPGVRRVHEDRMLHAARDPRPLVRFTPPAPREPPPPVAPGSGVVISIIDTGVDYLHPALGGGIGPTRKVRGGFDFINNDSDPRDDEGHGTHVAGIVAGRDGAFAGVAPDARLLAFKVLDNTGSGPTSAVIAGIERSLDPDRNPATNDGAHVINLSLGGPGTPDDPVSQAVDNAVRSGVICVVAAGNAGGGNRYETVGAPGGAREAITVGAADAARAVAPFSSRGPSAKLYAIKPDVVAPGVNINSAQMGGGYVQFSGTSMATPYVAGVVAVLKEQHPTWAPATIKAALMLSALDSPADVWMEGIGHVDLARATAMRTVVTPASLSPGLVPSGEATWTWTQTLRLVNLEGVQKTFQFSVGALPAGVSASVAPAGITVPASGTAEATFTLVVNNAALPFSGGMPPAYVSTVTARSGTETLTLPLGFLKSHSLNLTFPEDPWIVTVHEVEGNRFWAYGYPGAGLDVLLPQGRYNLITQYIEDASGRMSTVVREGINAQGAVPLTVRQAEAAFPLTVRGVTGSGAPLSLSYFNRGLAFKGSFGFSTSTSWGGYLSQLQDMISAASPDYTLRVRSAHFGSLAGSPFRSYHEGPKARSSGITGPVTVTNAAADVTAVDVQYATDPGTRELFVIDANCEGGGCSSSWNTTATSPNRIASPFSRRIYLLADEEGQPSYEQKVYRTDGEVITGGYPSVELYASNQYGLSRRALNPSSVFYPRPVFRIARAPAMRISVGGPLLRWAGRTYNTASRIRLGGADPFRNGVFIGYDMGYFRDPMGTIRLGPVPYRLRRDGVIVAQGTFEQRYVGAAYDDLSMPGGNYRLELDFEQYYVDGVRARATAYLDFNTSRSGDVDPPSLTRLVLLSNGELAGAAFPSARNEVVLGIADDRDRPDQHTPRLRYRPAGQSTWLDAPLVRQDSTFGAVLPATLGAGRYDLEITATDLAGNVLRYELNPAFHVSGLAVPTLATPLAGTSGVSVTPDLGWNAVTNALHYRLQVGRDSVFSAPAYDRDSLRALSQRIPTLLGRTKYFWRVRAAAAAEVGAWSEVRSFITGTSTAAEPIGEGLPVRFALHQNHPNPVGTTTVIAFDLPVGSEVTLRVYDSLGRVVADLASGTLPAGRHSRALDAASLPSGLYVCRFATRAFQQVRTFLVVRPSGSLRR